MFNCFKDKDFLKRFLNISLPVMVSAFITFLVTLIDNIMVGSVSNEAVSAVFAANEITFVFEIASFGIVEGAGIFLQQFNGINDENHMKQCFRYKLIFGFIFIIIAIPLVYIIGKDVIYFYCNKDKNAEMILKEGQNYLNILAFSYIPFMISQIYGTSLREIGATKYTMISSLAAVICNVVFNSIFIILLGMGVKGAAIATIISRIVEAICLISISHVKKMPFAYNFYKNFHIEKDLFKQMNKRTAFLFINEIGWSLGMILQSLAFSQRDGVLSAISVLTTVNNVVQILINGLSIGIGVMVGSSLGQKNYKKAKYEAKNLTLLGLYSSLAVGIILILTSAFIPQLFFEVDQAQKELASILIIILGALLFGRTVSAAIYFILKSGGNALITFFFDSGLMIILYLPVAWSLALFTNLSLIYIYLIVTSLDAVKAILGLIILNKYNWAKNLTTLNS